MAKKFKIELSGVKRFLLILFLISSAGSVGFRLGKESRFSSSKISTEQVDLSLFWYVWQRLSDRYLDQSALDRQKMVYGAISGMVSALGDPYTAFFPPSDNSINKEGLKGEFGGVGIQLGYEDGTLAVVSPLDDTPASRAGVKAGDLILKIKDEKKGVDRDTAGISLPEAVKLIRGPEGTAVVLTLSREGKESFTVSLVRDRITIPSLTAEWQEKEGKKIAYIHLLQFSEVMYEQWEDWVAEVVAEKNKSDFGGVVLDLRNNPGGFLDGAVFVAGEFIDHGTVVEQEGGGEKQIFSVNRGGQLIDVPLVVLVNRGSASAAEILAGALKHYRRAVIVGEKTFGKGSVQEPEDLPDGSGLHVTISRWLLPDGSSIDKEGVAPDVLVTENEEGEEDPILDRGKDLLLNGKP